MSTGSGTRSTDPVEKNCARAVKTSVVPVVASLVGSCGGDDEKDGGEEEERDCRRVGEESFLFVYSKHQRQAQRTRQHDFARPRLAYCPHRARERVKAGRHADVQGAGEADGAHEEAVGAVMQRGERSHGRQGEREGGCAKGEEQGGCGGDVDVGSIDQGYRDAQALRDVPAR
ncbi:hypothetical protein QFC19_008968 [Naganishia cerealis]|uniref:Uncharacterized protein n=1 Tax=Naganishia cerealis TaxID=610337 RepID=A0ACC2UY30_9TREE|nr:hypothetical protein QFC19_008968 [Naganishia cerealis]